MAEEIKTDRNGDVSIRLGNRTAKVKPESLGVWTSRGWKIITPAKEAEAASGNKTNQRS